MTTGSLHHGLNPSNIQSAYYKYVLYRQRLIVKTFEMPERRIGVSLSGSSMRAPSIHSRFQKCPQLGSPASKSFRNRLRSYEAFRLPVVSGLTEEKVDYVVQSLEGRQSLHRMRTLRIAMLVPCVPANHGTPEQFASFVEVR